MIHLVLAAALRLAPADRGQTLYETRCSSCHGMFLQGSPSGPPLIGTSAASVDFMLQTGRMPAAVPWVQPLRQKPQFSQPEIAALVRYITSASLPKGANLPQHTQTRSEYSQANVRAIVNDVVTNAHDRQGLPTIATGSARRGRAIFAQNCEQCHGVSAHGASVGYAIVAPSLMHAKPEQIAEAVRSGPGEMPHFGTDVISDRSLADVTRYVEYLQDDTRAYNPGGLQLANIGPVAEGFVAWVFGLGILVLFVRRIGSTD